MISTTSRRELSSSFFFLQGKTQKEIHAILTETLTCFLPGRAKDISAALYFSISHTIFPTCLFRPSPVPHFKTFCVFLMAETKAVIFYFSTPIYFNTDHKLLRFNFLNSFANVENGILKYLQLTTQLIVANLTSVFLTST